jgi:hypothetical protein
MRNAKYNKLLVITALVVALAFLVVGNVRVHEVYDAEAEEWGLVAFVKISERELIEDATFTGVVRKAEKLYSTYDRTQPRGKRLCPT